MGSSKKNEGKHKKKEKDDHGKLKKDRKRRRREEDDERGEKVCKAGRTRAQKTGEGVRGRQIKRWERRGEISWTRYRAVVRGGNEREEGYSSVLINFLSDPTVTVST